MTGAPGPVFALRDKIAVSITAQLTDGVSHADLAEYLLTEYDISERTDPPSASPDRVREREAARAYLVRHRIVLTPAQANTIDVSFGPDGAPCISWKRDGNRPPSIYYVEPNDAAEFLKAAGR